MIADAVERGELSATTERLVRRPGARPSVETSDVAAPRARLIVVRARRPVIRVNARGEDPGAGSAFLVDCSGRKTVFLYLPSLYVCLWDSGRIGRCTGELPGVTLYNLRFFLIRCLTSCEFQPSVTRRLITSEIEL